MRAEEILGLFPEESRDRWREVARQAKRLQEIRLRAGMPLTIFVDNREFFVDMQGRIVDMPGEAARPVPEELESLLGHLCRYSLYAFTDEIRQGFLTVQGGHRVGLAGQVILDGDGRIKNMKYIRYLNIRIAHQIRGAADALMPCLFEKGHVMSTLLSTFANMEKINAISVITTVKAEILSAPRYSIMSTIPSIMEWKISLDVASRKMTDR